MSLFNEMMADASEVLIDALAERDEHGSMAVVVYYPPGGGEVVDLVGCIVGALKEEPIENATGEVSMKETTTLTIESPKLSALELPLPERSKFELSKYPGASFNVNPSASDYGNAMVTIGLKRVPLTSKPQKRATGNG